ncbi:MAG TPA: anthranilate phosphoribosyltransferase [Chthoniobacteraceae bacterium]|jgi:anthranilate phosphoribosyltransferase
MRSLTLQLKGGADLSAAEIREAVGQLAIADADLQEKADFLEALRAKGETAAEIAGFVEALLALAVDPEIDPEKVHGPMIDVCGTGGDKMELFNVSTTSMFVLAAGGVTVVKHGNRAITSRCGGADVLEALGVRIELPPRDLKRGVETLGLGFVFAPAYHPAYKAIGPVRKALAARGIATIFNLLGPLLNPARPAHQLVGVFSPELLPKYAEALRVLGRKRAWVVHGAGFDEVSTNAPSEVIEVTTDGLQHLRVTPTDLGITPAPVEELRGGDCAQNAQILIGLLDGTLRGPKRDMVALNAAAGFLTAGVVRDLAEGWEHAQKTIDSGRAAKKLQALRDFT